MASAADMIRALEQKLRELKGDSDDPSPDDQPTFKFPPNTNYGKLMRKWDKPKRDGGYNADGFERFPMMLHRAVQHKSGKWVTSIPEPEYDGFRNEADFMRELQRVDRFNKSCQQIVENEQQYEALRSTGEGWCDKPDEALAWRESLEKEVSAAANARLRSDKKMSERAQIEAAAADAATDEHLPEVPRTPVRKGGKRIAAD